MLLTPTSTTVARDGANRSKDVRHVKFKSAEQVGQVVAYVQQVSQLQSCIPSTRDAEPGDVGRQRPKRTGVFSQFIVVARHDIDRRERVEGGDATLGFCGECDDRRRSLRAQLQRCVTSALSV